MSSPGSLLFSSSAFLSSEAFLFCLSVCFVFNLRVTQLVSYLFLFCPPITIHFSGLVYPPSLFFFNSSSLWRYSACCHHSLGLPPPADDSALFPPLTRTRPSR
ncbi:hypothetical protein V8C42DRAFT_66009 [Trichoderma barbatum]